MEFSTKLIIIIIEIIINILLFKRYQIFKRSRSPVAAVVAVSVELADGAVVVSVPVGAVAASNGG